MVRQTTSGGVAEVPTSTPVVIAEAVAGIAISDARTATATTMDISLFT
jgi:hypothetical protein